MNSARIEIRPLGSADAAAYRDLRLAALRDSPEAFGSTFERESVQPLAWFRDRLGKGPVFGAFRLSELVGTAGFVQREGEKEQHKGLLWGMYVRADARNAGIGRQLIEAVIDYARHYVELIQLSVVSDNERARGLYACLGFVEYGVEKNSLKQRGRYYDEILMALDLMREPDRHALHGQQIETGICEALAEPSVG